MHWHKIEGRGLLLQASGNQSYQQRKSEMSFQNQIWNGWITIENTCHAREFLSDDWYDTLQNWNQPRAYIILNRCSYTLSLCLVDKWDPMSTVVCWDVSTAIFTISKHASPDLFVNLMTLSFSQFITYNRDHSLFVSLDKSSSSCLRNLSQHWSWQPYVYCVLFSDACRL